MKIGRDNNIVDFDFYDYFNSQDVAEYCKKLNHSFSPIEKAVMISISYRSHTDRLAGYRALIPEATGVKTVMSRRGYLRDEIPHDFGDFLEAVIRNEEAMSRAFKGTEPDTVFQYTAYETNGCEGFDGNIQPTYEAALIELQKLYSDAPEDLRRCDIKKLPIGGSDKRYLRQEIRLDGTVLNTSYSCPDDEYAYEPNEEAIREIYIDVPSPFKEGDLIWYKGDYDSISIYLRDDAEWARSRNPDRPFGCDTSDMNAHGIVGDNDWIECDHIFQHTNLSYFKEELLANKLTMGLIHDYFTGERCLDGLIENIILLRGASALKGRSGYIYDKRVIDVYKGEIERYSKDEAEIAKYKAQSKPDV